MPNTVGHEARNDSEPGASIIPSTQHASRRLAAAAAVVAVAALAVSGCSKAHDGSASAGSASTSTTAAPTSVAATFAGPAPSTADTSQLDPGTYPTKPAKLGKVTDATGADSWSFTSAAIVEAHRMANYLTGPWAVDPAIIGQYATSEMAFDDAAEMFHITNEEVIDVAKRHGFINGVHSFRQGGPKKLANDIWRFPDAASAAAAAGEMAAARFKPAPDSENSRTRVQVPIPRHPDAHTVGGTARASDVQLTFQAVESYTAHGPYVLVQTANTVEGGLDAPAAMIARTLDLQAPLIDQFQPTAPADFASLSIDPTGLLARTLPANDKDALTFQQAVYGQRGAAQFETDPIRSAKLFSDTGMDLAAIGLTYVYQARDAAAATQIRDDSAAEFAAHARPTDGVKGLPDSRCEVMAGAQHVYYCTATAGRYAFETTSSKLQDAQQQIAAQYLLLTAK